MNKVTAIKALLLIIALASVESKLPHPAAKLREVHFNQVDTFKHLAEYIRSGAHDQHKNTKEFIEATDAVAEQNALGTCGTALAPHAWKFMGFTAANFKDTTAKSPSWTNHCFQENFASFQWLSDYSAKITITSDKQKYFGCSDTYAITDIYNFDLKVIDEKGTHEIIYKFNEQHNVDYVKKYGLTLTRLCDSHVHLLPDLYMTLALFALDGEVEDEKGEKTPKAIRDAIFAYHYDWLNTWAGYELVKRSEKVATTPEIIKTFVNTGDGFCRFAGTGLSSLIIWGTGSTCTHMGMFMWRDVGGGNKELHVFQSNGQGISEMTIEKFWETNDGTAIIVLPLSPDIKQQWDENKAYAWFKTVEGSPYGFANFLFGFFDTVNDNLPQLMDNNSWLTLITMLYSIPGVGHQIIEKVWSRAMSKRLGFMDQNLSWTQVIEESVKKGVSLGELMTIPEQESWLYDGQHQYVCSSFLAGMLYHGGAFKSGITIIPQEQTPRDVMEWNIWNKNYVLPDHCKQNDPDLPYCQLDGIYKVLPKFYNNVEPYDHMNEHCPTKSPNYIKVPGC